LLVALACSSSANPTPPGRNGLIAFVTHTYSSERGNGIAVVRADGSGFRRLTRNARDRSPAWSPDGRFLAFERGGRLYVTRVNGTGLRILTRRPFGEHHDPTWSPDGRYIAFVTEFVTESSLFVVRADGSGLRRLYRASGDAFVSGPSWSPDGRSIAFALTEEYGGGHLYGQIVVIKRNGRDLSYLTYSSGEGGDPGEEAEDSDPDWSPDGTRIAFTRMVWLCDRCDQEAIFSTYLDGSNTRWITTDTSFASARPSWSPDGKRIVAETSNGIAILDLAGKPLRIVNRRGTEPAWQPLSR
jgi:Tol biopolymer transport system component